MTRYPKPAEVESGKLKNCKLSLLTGATANGLEGIAFQRNDTSLVLDEIGEADPKEIGGVVYGINNGIGKSRANKSGNARAAKHWRVMLLSSGEVGLAASMAEAGKRPHAGQEIRLIDIRSNYAHGSWDNLHGLASGQEFSDAIKRASVTHYGHAGPAFVRKMLAFGGLDDLPKLLIEFCKQYPSTNGQESRVAEYFSLLAMSGELAIQFGILPLQAGTVRASMLELYEEWRSGRGEGLRGCRQNKLNSPLLLFGQP